MGRKIEWWIWTNQYWEKGGGRKRERKERIRKKEREGGSKGKTEEGEWKELLTVSPREGGPAGKEWKEPWSCRFDPWPRSVGWGSGVAVRCSVDCRRGLDLALLWLWCRPAAVALFWPLAWEPPYATGVALKRKKKSPRGYIRCSKFLCIKLVSVYGKIWNQLWPYYKVIVQWSTLTFRWLEGGEGWRSERENRQGERNEQRDRHELHTYKCRMRDLLKNNLVNPLAVQWENNNNNNNNNNLVKPTLEKNKWKMKNPTASWCFILFLLMTRSRLKSQSLFLNSNGFSSCSNVETMYYVTHFKGTSRKMY